jgi:cell division protein FtsW
LASEVEIGSQTQQSLKAFESGNLLGQGPGDGFVKLTLPDVHTDFIFSLAGEEYGVWLPSIIAIIFAIIVVRFMRLSVKDNNLFVMYAASGLAASVGLQAIVNMCSTLKIIPAKGMTLPFISYGGSSMLACSLAMGMLLAITRKNAVAEDKDIK